MLHVTWINQLHDVFFFTIAICRSHTHHTYLIFSEHKFYETIMCPWSPRPFSWYLERHQRWPGTFSWMKWRRVYKRIEYLADLWMFQFCYCHLLITPFWLPLRGIYLNKIHYIHNDQWNDIFCLNNVVIRNLLFLFHDLFLNGSCDDNNIWYAIDIF